MTKTIRRPQARWSSSWETTGASSGAKASALAAKGAVAAIIADTAERAAQFQRAPQLPTLPVKLEGPEASGLENEFNLLEASPEATAALEALPENTGLTFDGPSTAEKKYTWNAIGILRGRDPKLQSTAVLLSAHLDHLGIGPGSEWG